MITFKQNIGITNIENTEYNQWYQCTATWTKQSTTFLLRRVRENLCICIFSDESSGTFDTEAIKRWKNFTAFPVKLNIEVV